MLRRPCVPQDARSVALYRARAALMKRCLLRRARVERLGSRAAGVRPQGVPGRRAPITRLGGRTRRGYSPRRFIKRYRVVRSTPRVVAAIARLPLAASSAARIRETEARSR